MSALTTSAELRMLGDKADRLNRKRSLQHFHKILLTNKDSVVAQGSKLELFNFFSELLSTHLLELFKDEAEKCRELSLNLATKIVGFCDEGDFSSFFMLFVDVFMSRVSTTPFEEKSEEVRLLLVNLMLALLSHESVTSIPDNVVGAIASCLGDNFPEVKRQCCLVIVKLCKKTPKGIQMASEKLLKALIINTTHQHSKTRQMSVKAIGFVCVSAAPDNFEQIMKEVVLPCLKKVSFDRVPNVRKALISGAIGKLATVGVQGGTEIKKTYEQFVPDFLSFLMLGVSDGTPEVEEVAHNELKRLADLRKANIVNDSTDDNGDNVNALISNHFAKILVPMLEESSHWTTQQRHRSLESLEQLISHMNGTQIEKDHVEMIIKSLTFSIRDDEKIIRSVATRCAVILGEVVELEVNLKMLLPRLDGSISGMNTPEKITGSLLILASIFQGADGKSLLESREVITKTLATNTILECDNQNVLDALFEAVEGFVNGAGNAGGGLEGVNGTNVMRCCIQLLGVGSDNFLFHPALGLVRSVAKFRNCARGDAQLFDTHFRSLVNMIKAQPPDSGDAQADKENGEFGEGVSRWTPTDSRLRAFEALIRTSGSVSAKYFGEIIDIFETHMNEETETGVRVKMMAILESILNSVGDTESNTESSQEVQKYSSRLINKVICPSLVWRAGGPASTVRKVTIACLYTLLKSGNAVSKNTLFGVAPKLLPPLKSNLGDYDASTRQLVCLNLKFMFEALPGALGEEPVHQLYPELLKCLDDSSDEVRFAVCGTLKAFLLAAPVSHFKGTLFDYLVDQLLIHLDDPDLSIQKAVLEILVVAFRIDKGIIMKKARVARNCHRDTIMCDLLIKQLTIE